MKHVRLVPVVVMFLNIGLVSYDCKSDCKENNRKAVKLCDTLYPPDSRSKDHTDCLEKAKEKYKACMALC